MEVPNALRTAKALRMPVFDSDDPERFVPPQQKLEQLGDYIALTAFWQGELSSEVLDLQEEMSEIEDEWTELVGYEVHQGGRKTDRSVDEAKAQHAPELAKRRRESKRLLKMLEQEIDRLERESVKASRIVTTVIGK